MASEFDNKLKSISIHQLETAIAKAINDLVGGNYECSISNLSFTNIMQASFQASINPSIKSDWLKNNAEISDDKGK